jgi:hypothetical protein
VSQHNPELTDQHQEGSVAAANVPVDQGIKAYNRLLERITP